MSKNDNSNSKGFLQEDDSADDPYIRVYQHDKDISILQCEIDILKVEISELQKLLKPTYNQEDTMTRKYLTINEQELAEQNDKPANIEEEHENDAYLTWDEFEEEKEDIDLRLDLLTLHSDDLQQRIEELEKQVNKIMGQIKRLSSKVKIAQSTAEIGGERHL